MEDIIGQLTEMVKKTITIQYYEETLYLKFKW
jgi:hypothetical protein